MAAVAEQGADGVEQEDDVLGHGCRGDPGGSGGEAVWVVAGMSTSMFDILNMVVRVIARSISGAWPDGFAGIAGISTLSRECQIDIWVFGQSFRRREPDLEAGIR